MWSLFFVRCAALDVIAFLMIAACSYKSVHTFSSSSLFGRVVQDATVYFLVIVWVHLTVMIYVSLMGPVSSLPFHFPLFLLSLVD